MIEAWKRVLVLAPHTDDGEFGCGGTMARLVETGADVRYVAFSIATKSLPEGFAPDTLAREVREATRELGIAEANLTVHDFEVRTFPERRQDILELLIALWEDWRPDAVFQPSLHDVHQDHQVVAAEGLRAFKRTTILGYEIPWNNFDFAYQWYSALEKSHIEKKAAALAKYASQQHRRYADPEYIWNVARTHGINVNREYAEVFQVYRVVDYVAAAVVRVLVLSPGARLVGRLLRRPFEQEAVVGSDERVGRDHGVGVVDGAVLAREGDPARILAQPVLELRPDLARPVLEPAGRVVDHLLHLGDLLRLLLGQREAEVEGEVGVVGGDIGELPAHPLLVGGEALDRRPREADQGHVAVVEVDERTVEAVRETGAAGAGAVRRSRART